jgi:hypothetical protein
VSLRLLYLVFCRIASWLSLLARTSTADPGPDAIMIERRQLINLGHPVR